MLNTWHTLVDGAQAALAASSGTAAPWLIATTLALTTLLLEDLAIAAGVALATQGLIGWPLSMAAVGGGIALGDIGLYGLGLAATRVPGLRRRWIDAPAGTTAQRRALWIHTQLRQRLASAVLLARVVPGLRLVTYTACGFLRVPLAAFSAWVLLAVALWTLGLYGLSVAIGAELATRLGLAPAVAVAIPVIVLAAAVPLLRALRRRHQLSKAPSPR